MMKPVIISVSLFAFVTLIHGYSQPIIFNTKAEGLINGVDAPHCAWDEAHILPEEQLNQPGKCRLLRCTKEFDIYITPCPFDSKKISCATTEPL